MEQNINIDRKSFEPAYIQLVNILRDQIASGQFRTGQRLPSESQLCERYQVSPMTVRRAVNILMDQGLVNTAQGRGTFVKPMELSAVMFGLDELQNFFRKNSETKVKMLEVRIVRSDSATAAKLDIKVGDRIILIRRLITKELEPIFYHQEYLIYDPARPIVEAEMEVTSLYGLFAGTGETSIKRGELAIEAAVLNEPEAHLLMAPVMLPSFRLEHIFYDYDGRPVSWGTFLCRGDRLRFRTTVGPSDKVPVAAKLSRRDHESA
jgi:DNA-binding GntR family transcriptional regulator